MYSNCECQERIVRETRYIKTYSKQLDFLLLQSVLSILNSKMPYNKKTIVKL